MEPVFIELRNKINASLDHLRSELASIRAGRANPAIIENIPVLAYGARMKLVELGNIAAPQPQLLTVQVWDAGILQEVVKAIQEANLGLNPSFEGQLIRLPIPPLTAERRDQFIKLAHAKMENTKIALRQIRQETRKSWESLKDSDEIGEDELDRRSKVLQEFIDKAIAEVDLLGKRKEGDLREV